MNKFGGKWTEQKLEVVGNYLNFYTNALKNQKFKKIYIDCFAGSGNIEIDDNKPIKGSSRIALDIENKFDRYIFIETKKENIIELEKLKQEYPKLNIEVIYGDCNIELPKVLSRIDWRYNRGVLFIDPYATQLEFERLREVSLTKAIDVWYLFPYSAVNRLLKKDGDIEASWKKIIDKCLGNEDWREELYKQNPQLNLWGIESKNKVGSEKVKDYIYIQFKKIFPYVSDKYMELKNSMNSPMFLLFLLISTDNQNAIRIVKKVENYILKG